VFVLLLLCLFKRICHQTRNCALDEAPPIPWDRVILVCVQEIVHSLNSDLWVAQFYGEEESEVGDDCSDLVEMFCASTETAIRHNCATPRSK